MNVLKRLAFLLTLLVSIQTLGFAQAPAATQGLGRGGSTTPELDPAAWKRYTSAAGNFSALFPGTPTEESHGAQVSGHDAVLHVALLQTAAGYIVSYADLPYEAERAEKISDLLTGARDRAVATMNGRLLDDTEIKYVGHPGRVFTVETAGGAVTTTKVFVVKNRLYMVTATYNGEKKNPPDIARFYEAAARRFIGSFMLISDENEKKDFGNADPVTPPSPLTETGEDEVTKVKRELEAKGEPVFGICAVDKPCDSIKGKTINGRVIKGDVVLPKAINRPQPAYPAIARAARASGPVVVQVIVDENGKVIAAHAVSGNPLLHVAAERAARDWEFTPTIIDGRPVKVIGTITFNFTLQ